MFTQRQARMARRLREDISQILLREIDDPLVRLVTITDVEVSADLKHARIFFSVIPGEQRPPDALRGLRRAAKYIRHRLAETAELRFTPTLDFRYDPTAERAQRIEAILHRLAEERALRAEPDGEPPHQAPGEPTSGDDA